MTDELPGLQAQSLILSTGAFIDATFAHYSRPRTGLASAARDGSGHVRATMMPVIPEGARVPAKLSGDLECAQRAEGVAGVVA